MFKALSIAPFDDLLSIVMHHCVLRGEWDPLFKTPQNSHNIFRAHLWAMHYIIGLCFDFDFVANGCTKWVPMDPLDKITPDLERSPRGLPDSDPPEIQRPKD